MTMEHSATDSQTGAKDTNGVMSHATDSFAGYKPKLIEVALPLKDISEASAREKFIRHGHPSTLHLWWARRPLASARAVIWASLVDDPSGHPDRFPTEESQTRERQRLFNILKRLVVWKNSNDPKVLADAQAEIEASCGSDLPIMMDPFIGGVRCIRISASRTSGPRKRFKPGCCVDLKGVGGNPAAIWRQTADQS